MRVSASSASPSRMPRGGMKVVNEYLATKEGLAAGEWKRRSRAWSTSSRKRAPPLFTKENVELLESADKRKPAREKPGTSNTPATKKCSKSSRPGRLRGRAVVVQGMQS